jgi:diketogulonate reductase-like aldo/keto reductase
MSTPRIDEKMVTLPSGEKVPAFGLGTWRMGESRAARKDEVAIVKYALERGVRLIDTAEMYGEGGAEEIIGEAIRGRRDGLFIVSKVYPHNASRQGTVAACERSLRRLGTDIIDLYLLHWSGSIPIVQTLEGFMALRDAGRIRYFGVSNFDAEDLAELWDAPGGNQIAANQLLYNLTRRGIEWETLPWMRSRDVPIMAYSPLEQARLLRSSELQRFAQTHGMTPAQAALRWLLAQDDVIVIPKTVKRDRLDEDLAALDADLTVEQLAELDQLFPPPARLTPLDVL